MSSFFQVKCPSGHVLVIATSAASLVHYCPACAQIAHDPKL
jgi:ribosomal protein S27E